MNFNSLEFLFFFLPITLLVFHSVPRQMRLHVLVAASLIFYASSGLVPALFMVLCIIWAFLTAFVIARYPGWPSTLLAISLPLWVIFMFRYLDFTLTNVGASVESRDSFDFFLSVLVPAGISFYTFQIASYSLDVARGRVVVERSFLRLASFVMAFPQLIAGPILRYDDLRAQLQRLSEEQAIGANFPLGLKMLSVGLFAKIFLADILATVVKTYFDVNRSESSLDAAYSVLAYSFRIYFDFWAYSVMAIGLGAMLGLTIPRNFLQPYKSLNPQDFWRRWHTTLSYWLRDYVYIPLGGNKAYARNIVIVFLACGLWHGAGWNFVLWGAYHAALVLLYRIIRTWWDRLPSVLQIGLTFTLVSLGWPLFYLDISNYWQLIQLIFSFDILGGNSFKSTHWLYLLIPTVIVFFTNEERWLYQPMRPRSLSDSPVVHAGMLSMAVLMLQFRETFIYFRF